jgi:Ser/Thr protein kinase RdoA (MazF antagonist)
VIHTDCVPTKDVRPPLEPFAGIVEEQLRLNYDSAATVVGITTRPLVASTSSMIDEVDVELSGGRRLDLIAKNVGPEGFLGAATRVKPGFLRDPLREIEVYGSLLRYGEHGTPAYFGAHAESRRDEYILLLERVRGVELQTVEFSTTWLAAARWLAAFHNRSATGRRPALESLVSYDSEFFRLWPARAEANLGRLGADNARRRSLDRVINSYDRVVEVLTSLPSTVVHGEFYPSNVLVRERTAARPPVGDNLICPVDWEMAGWGPGFVDLAALASGNWDEAQRRAFVGAYASGTTATQVSHATADELMLLLDHYLLHVAMQWLGWAADWTPPTHHQQDWLDLALGAARRIGLPT